MSAHLQPCPSCKRHVRVSSDACPFCTFLLSDSFRATAARPLPTRRLGRAATFAFGAAIAGAAACGPHSGQPRAPEGDQSGSVGEIYGGPPSPPPPMPPAPPSTPPPAVPAPPPENVAPAYGVPPPMPPPPPGPSGGAHSGAVPPRTPRVQPDPDPGAVVALYGVPFDPQRIGGGQIGTDGTGSVAPAPRARRPSSPRDPK